MISTWRRRRESRRANKKADGKPNMVLTIPTHFRCPISLDLMRDPVTLSSGITYDRESIETWLESGNFTCPVTGQVLRSSDQVPNHTIRRMIQEWCVENRRYGVERVPTPRVPVTSIEVSEILSRITASTLEGDDQNGCLELVQKIKKWGTESERNRLCILANGTACVLAAAFDALATASFERNTAVLEEILSVLNWLFPLDVEAQMYLSSPASLRCMVWFLKCKDLSASGNAILALKELLSFDQQLGEALIQLEGVVEVLVKLIKEPISSTTTKASLMVVYYLVSSSASEEAKSTFVEIGLVSLLLEILIDSERSICESALGVFDRLCDCEEGREKAYSNDLAIPVLVKKILRVSDLATEFSVSTIWKLCKYEESDERSVLVEALQVGAFQKLLLLLQVGCGDGTKEKATELLKLLNPHRAGLECTESIDFKNLKRPF